MRTLLNSLKCRFSGKHIERCQIVILPALKIRDHIHVCVRCAKVTKAEITSFEEEGYDRATLVMGMAPEDQSRYLN